MNTPLIYRVLCGVAFVSAPTLVQSTDSTTISEMARLAKVLAGNWDTVEIVQQGKPVPDGAGRRGTVHVRVAGGGTALAVSKTST